MDWQHQVRLFMTEVKGLDLPRQPTIPDEIVKKLCYSLINEELSELCHHMFGEDPPDGEGPPIDELVTVADDLADSLYVVLYTANAYGLYMEPIFTEIQRSNMSKKGGPKREDGKQLKPANYSPPNLEPIIRAQQYRPVAYVEGQDIPVAWQQPDTGKIVQDWSD